ncbi:hypothetical protein [Cytobacillus gottheilii]|uniref:hypothetical protein n=1 Tax=Cytobacillus gottheilii TaxID=859144 RepID=UPI00082DAC86|nr:hypothetical protein [Cytobacillus gottheilii]
MDTKKEILHMWQPKELENLNAKNAAEIVFEEVIRHNDFFKITLKDFDDKKVEIIYDQLSSPVEYFVWSFRFSTEYGRPDLHTLTQEASGRKNKNSPYFFKVENSNYVNWMDKNPIINSKTNPNLEHHMYLSGDEVLEVLSDYEPVFRVVK